MKNIVRVYAVLRLLDKFGKIEGRTRFQKIIFLLDHKNSLRFNFEKSNYGPFSGRLIDMLHVMEKDGDVKEYTIKIRDRIKYEYEITKQGKRGINGIERVINKEDKKKIFNWLEFIQKNQFDSVALTTLISYVYSQYPKFEGDFFKKDSTS